MPCDGKNRRDVPCDGDCACDDPRRDVPRETLPDVDVEPVEPVEGSEDDEPCDGCPPGKGCRAPVGPFVRHMVSAWADCLGLDEKLLRGQDDEFYRLWFKGMMVLAADSWSLVELQTRPLDIQEKIHRVTQHQKDSSENLYHLLRICVPFVKRSDDGLYPILLLLSLHARQAPGRIIDDLNIPEWALIRMVELGHLVVDDGGKGVAQA